MNDADRKWIPSSETKRRRILNIHYVRISVAVELAIIYNWLGGFIFSGMCKSEQEWECQISLHIAVFISRRKKNVY